MATEEQPEGAPGECLACRGTGRLQSGLGGTPHEVACPWCEGTGTRIPGIDAQAHPAEDGPAARGDASGDAGASASGEETRPA